MTSQQQRHVLSEPSILSISMFWQCGSHRTSPISYTPLIHRLPWDTRPGTRDQFKVPPSVNTDKTSIWRQAELYQWNGNVNHKWLGTVLRRRQLAQQRNDGRLTTNQLSIFVVCQSHTVHTTSTSMNSQGLWIISHSWKGWHHSSSSSYSANMCA